MAQLDCLTAALRYAHRGWAVFPLNGKTPFRDTNGWHDATTETKQIHRWWKRWPQANVAIACDSRRGPIVLDIDGPSGYELLSKLDLPPTREAQSRKGRLHLYFDPMANGKIITRMLKIKYDGVKHDLDILGDGGYVVAPPSVHADTGRPYKWLNKHRLQPLPSSVLKIIQIENTKSKTSAPPLPNMIGEGERDTLLTSLAGSMRRRGASEEGILAALREENATRVNPPLPDGQLRKIARSIAQKPPAGTGEHYTDLGNARRFIAQHHIDVRAVPAQRKSWYVWEGPRWVVDESGEVHRRAKATVRSLYVEASHASDEESRDLILKHASKSEQSSKITSMLELAKTEPEISLTIDQLDSDPYLFNVENGTINLKTGELRPHRRKDLITKLAPVEYNEKARASRWNDFVSEIMNGDEELVKFLQHAIGYTMTGDTREECLFFCYGTGRNGKTKLFEVLREIFGGYAQQADFSSFLSRRGEGPRDDLAGMRGARLVTASEADGERGFDAAVLKQLTGGDTIRARHLYESSFEYRPQHKLWLAANHKPLVKEQTEAFWSRIRLIPFTVTFSKEQRDKNLILKLRKELPGILNWMVEGVMKWRAEGLAEPRAVTKATKAYREENDVLGEFSSQRCVYEPDAWTSTAQLYREFSDWWVETRGPRSAPISLGWFSRMLSERPQLRMIKQAGIRGWKGISIKLTQEVQ
jgi:putative DNA primase/helicase